MLQRTQRLAAVLGLGLSLGGCPAPPPPPPVTPAESAEAAAAKIPLERVCQDALPLPQRNVGALVRLLRRINPAVEVQVRPCKAGTQWPIAYATGEQLPRPQVGFVVLKMEGDALLTFDTKDRESPTINLCADLLLVPDDDHKVRAIALWDSSDEKAFDPKKPEASQAQIAWLELYSRTPSACALGRKEEPGAVGEAALDVRVRCAELPLVLSKLDACEAASDSAPLPPQPTAADVERATAANHRFTGAGREASPEKLGLKLEAPERCLYEPPPAARDVCLAEYTDVTGARWYGRGDVTRTGSGGEKNYVDSYLTFQLLKRIEAERKGAKRGAPAAPGMGTVPAATTGAPEGPSKN